MVGDQGDPTPGDPSQGDPTPGDPTPGDPGGQGDEAGCVLVTLSFRAQIVTIAGTPFGLDTAVDRLRMAGGTMTYDTCVPDTDTFSSPTTGEFDHVARETGAFSFALDDPIGDEVVELQIAGSTRPMVGIRDLDYFDFEDGGYDVFEEVARYVTVNSALDHEAIVDFTIGSGPTDFVEDLLPAAFPYAGTSETEFDCVQASDYCVTFAVKESTFGDSFLMALHALEQIAP